MSSRRVSRLALASGLAVIAAVAPAIARAQPSPRCVQSVEKGQDARERGALRTARAHFVACAADACPKQMRVDCTRWLEEVDASLPSIVVGAKDASGADLFDVRVTVDSEPVDDMASGRPIVLDPGPHVVRFERGTAPGSDVREVKVILRTGERNRAVLATMGAAAREISTRDSDTTSDRGHAVPTASWIFGGLGVLALGSFGTFAFLGSQEKSRLRDTCSPSCTDHDVGTLRADYIVADISLGVGLVALGVATYFLLTNEPGPRAHRAASLTAAERLRTGH